MPAEEQQELTHELTRSRWDILGFAEVRRTSATDEGHTIWYCGDDSKHQFGVAFIVQNEAVGSIIR